MINSKLIPAEFIRAIDGDTAEFQYKHPESGKTETYTVRMLLVDTPEMNSYDGGTPQTYAVEAKRYLETALNNAKDVYIEYDTSLTDHYDRQLAYVWTDNALLNERLIKEGLARVDYVSMPNIRHLGRLYQAEEDAAGKEKGIWTDIKGAYNGEGTSIEIPKNPAYDNPISNPGTTLPNESNIDNPLTTTYNKYGFMDSKASPHREFFSGANVKVYFGDVWLDQIAGISYVLQENVAPIYGFKSYTFDRISRGTRYVQGEFVINFTENGYMQNILDKIRTGMEDVQEAIEQEESFAYVTSLSEEQNIRDLLAVGNTDRYAENIQSLKESFWGISNEFTAPSSKKERDSFYYAEVAGKENLLREHGFNILIDYSPDANQRDFEDCLKLRKDKKSFYQTFRSIVGVHLTGESQEISNNGQVIQQRFQFMARDLDSDITLPSLTHNFRLEQPTVISTDKYKYKNHETNRSPWGGWEQGPISN